MLYDPVRKFWYEKVVDTKTSLHNINIMCPTMSLAATIIFSMILGGAPVWQLPAIWAGTLIKNFPMAFFWNMFAAAPFTNWACGKLFE